MEIDLNEYLSQKANEVGRRITEERETDLKNLFEIKSKEEVILFIEKYNSDEMFRNMANKLSEYHFMIEKKVNEIWMKTII